MSVNKERVQLLVNALRSGEFRQGAGALRRGNFYCCLGVATEVALRNGLQLTETEKNRNYPWDQSYQVMCEPVYQWFGFTTGNPTLAGVRLRDFDAASHWNDDLQVEFPEIADMFENTYIRETTPPV